MLNVIFYAAISSSAGWRRLLAVHRAAHAFGIAWRRNGVGASLALESAPPRIRGLLSGLLQEARDRNLLAASPSGPCIPGPPSTIPATPGADVLSRRSPALLSLFIRMRVKESAAWHEHRTTGRRTGYLVRNGRRFFYLVCS